MTARPPRRRLRRDCHGTTAMEFAVIASVLLPILFGTLGLGLLMWTHNALQSTAALTARCVAIGCCVVPGSSQCLAPAQFAVDTAQQWIVPGIITTGQVTIPYTPPNPAPSCNGTAGSFVTVAITSTYWAADILPQPFAAIALQVSACFPVLAG